LFTIHYITINDSLLSIHYSLLTKMIQTIRSQALALIAEITAQPKPTYTIDGQSVAWADYLERLQKTVDWCDRQIADAEPVEIVSQAR